MEWVALIVAGLLFVAWMAGTSGPHSLNRPPSMPPSLERRRARRSDGRPGGYYYGWWGDILRGSGYRCYYCGFHAPNRTVRLHKERVIPLSRGGPHHVDNIKPACQRCNLIKGTLTGEEFFELIRSNSGEVPLTRSKKKIPKERSTSQRQLVLEAVARLQVGTTHADSWSIEEIVREILAESPAVNVNSLRATISTMGTKGLLDRVSRGRYRMPP